MGGGRGGAPALPYFVNDNHSQNYNHSQLADLPNFTSENHSHLLGKLYKV